VNREKTLELFVFVDEDASEDELRGEKKPRCLQSPTDIFEMHVQDETQQQVEDFYNRHCEACLQVTISTNTPTAAKRVCLLNYLKLYIVLL